MGRSPCNNNSSEESGLKKGPWTPEEDEQLIKHIHKHGHGSWRALPKLAGLNRCGKSCRLRWTNYLRPDIKRGKFSQDEEQTILNLHSILGNKWSAIATHLPGRTDNEIKNFWNTHLKKKLIHMGFDPMTHQPRSDIFSTLPHLIALATLIENPSLWEEQAMRLQAEQAVHMARLNNCLQNLLQQPPPSFLPPPPPTFQLNNNTIADMADFNLLSHYEAAAAIPAGVLQEPMGFSHLPDLEVYDFGGLISHGENSAGSSSSEWLRQNLPPPPAAAPVVAESNSFTNVVDGCSASSYEGGGQMWSELLDDPIFHDIA
ncbi:hypothetical protein ABFX02_12G012900 [Erythranthe guttata]